MKYLILCPALFTAFIITGCSHTSELTREHLPGNETGVDYSVIYYIHADADYLYHTPDGDPVRENSEVLATAIEVAEAAQSGEVFIYHQRPEKKLFGIFPRRNSRFYHFRNGQQINRVKYRYPDEKEAFLATEAQLMNKVRAHNKTDEHQNFLLYFGHEIPSENGKGYHQSLPGIDVNEVSFAKGVQRFLVSDEDRFDLVVLSTCNNGTPAMANLLMPFTDAMLASPQNLHLSHFDSNSLDLLEINPPPVSPLRIANSMAGQTYRRLDKEIETTITLSVYDFEIVQEYIDKLHGIVTRYNTSIHTNPFSDNIDCKQLGLFDDEFKKGIETWYKPARFGRKSQAKTHSGWGCKPHIEK